MISALKYLHGRNVLHQDIKPSNVMISEKTKNVKLIDLGVGGGDKAVK